MRIRTLILEILKVADYDLYKSYESPEDSETEETAQLFMNRMENRVVDFCSSSGMKQEQVYQLLEDSQNREHSQN